MPEELFVLDIFGISEVILLFVKFEDVKNIEGVVVMGGGMGVLHILLQYLIQLGLLGDRLHVCLKTKVVGVDLINITDLAFT